MRERLEKLLVMLDEQHEAVAKAAVPMVEEHERRQPQKELEEG
jgi:hypothetical protein